MALNEIDSSKIEAPNQSLVDSLVKKTADPEVYVEWLLLFDEYNKTHPKKSMGCRPCYGVVYMWYQQELKKQKNEAL